MLNINIGGTKNWSKIKVDVRANWKILDIAGSPDYKYDLNSGLFFPFGADKVDNYYCSHTLEHVRPEMISFVLGQMHYTLKTNGLVRIVVPDVKIGLRKYVEGDKVWLKRTPPTKPAILPNTMLGHLMAWFYSPDNTKGSSRSGHHMVFDWETICVYLELAGFRNIGRMRWNFCSDVFVGLDLRRYKDFSIFLEAQK